MSALPLFEQVLEIPATRRQEVPPKFLDQNLHMNVRHYLDFAALSLTDRCANLGLWANIEETGLSLFTAEHHIRYVAELRQGDDISAHVRFLDRGSRSMHAMVFILNRSSGVVAYTLEVILIHISMATRRTVDFAEDIAGRIDAAIKADDYSWPAPVCGVMGIRHE